MTERLEKPTRTDVAMVLAMLGGKEGLFWIARQCPLSADEKLSMWHTDVLPHETPAQAAARCAESQIWDVPPGLIDENLFYPAGRCETEGSVIFTFFMPFRISKDYRRPDCGETWVPVEFLAEFESKITQPTLTALEHVPDRILRASMR